VLTSVVIPTHDRRGLVRTAVASVLSQANVDLELIVVDDGSTDGTAAALEAEFGAAIKVLRTPNRGVAAARNTGVARSSGAWIAFLDSDDAWLPGKLAAQCALVAVDPSVEICQTQEIWIRNGRRVNPPSFHNSACGRIFEPSLRHCLISASAVMLRRSLFARVGGFAEDLPACEDYDLWLRILRNTPLHLVEQPLVLKHGGHADQLSRRHWGMDRFRVTALRRLLATGELDPQHAAATRMVLAEKCAILAAGAERRGRSADARAFLQIAACHA